MDTQIKALAVARAAQDKKGQNLTIIDLEGASSYADALVIVSAYSDRQTGAIADGVVRALKTQYALHPVSVEGESSWVLIDYGDVIVHVFHEDTRAYYDLERLWGDAPRLPVPPPIDFAANQG